MFHVITLAATWFDNLLYSLNSLSAISRSPSNSSSRILNIPLSVELAARTVNRIAAHMLSDNSRAAATSAILAAKSYGIVSHPMPRVSYVSSHVSPSDLFSPRDSIDVYLWYAHFDCPSVVANLAVCAACCGDWSTWRTFRCLETTALFAETTVRHLRHAIASPVVRRR